MTDVVGKRIDRSILFKGVPDFDELNESVQVYGQYALINKCPASIFLV
jgi:hypothetical protein